MPNLKPIGDRDVRYTPAEIHFPEYGDYVESAKAVAEFIRKVELDESNVKEVKKVLANARKVTDSLSARRIEVKKAIMVSYDRFDEQIKAIAAIVSEAEQELRAKVREMEDAEKDGKKQEIVDLYRKRAKFYTITQLSEDAGFMTWWDNKYLNKTAKMKDIEADMTAFLESTERDIMALKTMNGAYLEEYLICMDMAQAIRAVDDRRKARETIRAAEGEEVARFTVRGKANIRLAEMLLKDNEIEFVKE